MKNKKAQMTGPLLGLVTGVIVFLVLGFVLSITANVMEDYQGSLTAGDASHNATADNLGGLDKISGFQGTIGLVMVAGTIIAILIIGLLGLLISRGIRG